MTLVRGLAVAYVAILVVSVTSALGAEVALRQVSESASNRGVYVATSTVKAGPSSDFFILVNATRKSVGHVYGLTLTRQDGHAKSTKLQTTFKIKHAGLQGVVVRSELPLPAEGEWRVEMTGAAPVPTALQLDPDAASTPSAMSATDGQLVMRRRVIVDGKVRYATAVTTRPIRPRVVSVKQTRVKKTTAVSHKTWTRKTVAVKKVKPRKTVRVRRVVRRR